MTRRYNGSDIRYSKIRRMANRMKRPIKLYWYNEEHNNNFGDEASQYFILKLFGYRVKWTPVKKCELIAMGSILGKMDREDPKGKHKVWGSGFSQDTKNSRLDDYEFYAVRGKNTLNRINAKGKVALGDPGILAEFVYPKAKRKNNKIGVVVHYIDSDLPIVEKIRKDKRFLIINPLMPVKKVAKQISSCRGVLSSSLHGLVFADSYDVPNVHVKFSDKVCGGEYKFKDYYTGVGKEYRVLDDMLDIKKVEEALAAWKPIPKKRELQKALIDSFPFK